MELYVRFMVSLAAGLVGLGLVMKIVMDELLVDYDAPAHIAAWCKDAISNKRLLRHSRAEDLMLEMEKARQTEGVVRGIDRRREQLRELASVESRLQGPAAKGPIVLTPLTPVTDRSTE